jgi:hypothetical protein
MLQLLISWRVLLHHSSRSFHTFRTNSECPAGGRAHAHDLRPSTSEALSGERTGESAPCDCDGGHCVRRGDLCVCVFVRNKEEKFSCNRKCQWEMSPIDSISQSNLGEPRVLLPVT